MNRKLKDQLKQLIFAGVMQTVWGMQQVDYLGNILYNKREVIKLSLAKNAVVTKNINGFKQCLVKIHGKTCYSRAIKQSSGYSICVKKNIQNHYFSTASLETGETDK